MHFSSDESYDCIDSEMTPFLPRTFLIWTISGIIPLEVCNKVSSCVVIVASTITPSSTYHRVVMAVPWSNSHPQISIRSMECHHEVRQPIVNSCIFYTQHLSVLRKNWSCFKTSGMIIEPMYNGWRSDQKTRQPGSALFYIWYRSTKHRGNFKEIFTSMLMALTSEHLGQLWYTK